MAFPIIITPEAIRNNIAPLANEMQEIGVEFFTQSVLSINGSSVYYNNNWSEWVQCWFALMSRLNTCPVWNGGLKEKINNTVPKKIYQKKTVIDTSVTHWHALKAHNVGDNVLIKARADFFKGLCGFFYIKEIHIHEKVFFEVNNIAFRANSVEDVMIFFSHNIGMIDLYIEAISKRHTDILYSADKEMFDTNNKVLLKS